ncbi:hypothetical protein GEMRC1_008166 [Eukaryota sp. GEM-RC1]
MYECVKRVRPFSVQVSMAAWFDSDFSDLTVIYMNQTISLHKVVVCSKLSFFKDLSDSIVDLSDLLHVEFSILSDVLKTLYTHPLPVTPSNIHALFECASVVDYESLQLYIIGTLKEYKDDPNWILSVLSSAERFSNPQLLQKALNISPECDLSLLFADHLKRHQHHVHLLNPQILSQNTLSSLLDLQPRTPALSYWLLRSLSITPPDLISLPSSTIDNLSSLLISPLSDLLLENQSLSLSSLPSNVESTRKYTAKNKLSCLIYFPSSECTVQAMAKGYSSCNSNAVFTIGNSSSTEDNLDNIDVLIIAGVLKNPIISSKITDWVSTNRPVIVLEQSAAKQFVGEEIHDVAVPVTSPVLYGPAGSFVPSRFHTVYSFLNDSELEIQSFGITSSKTVPKQESIVIDCFPGEVSRPSLVYRNHDGSHQMFIGINPYDGYINHGEALGKLVHGVAQYLYLLSSGEVEFELFDGGRIEY